MKEETILEKILFILTNIPNWFRQALCKHDFYHEDMEKGWFGTGSLSFHVMCSKCDKSEFIKMKFPPQKDLES